MNLAPIFIMNSLLLVVTILLAVADRLLINYGDCKIKVHKDDDEKEFTVKGGGLLLHSLVENGVEISASCAGKASCGYCKVRVLSGGGPVLPTEEVFMSRQEKREGVRLSCQVKVKEDIEIAIPDFLSIVRGIVTNKTYNPRARWRFQIGTLKHRHPVAGAIPFGEEETEKVIKLVEAHPKDESSLIPVLQGINETFNYLPESVFPVVASNLGVPVSTAYRVATFYNAFSLVPRGKHIISVCLGTACHVKGAGNIMTTLESELGVKSGTTTEDMVFTLEGVRCIGCCGLAPVLTVGEDVHGLMTVKKTMDMVKTYKEKEA